MVEYSVVLKRFNAPDRPDVIVFQDENREKAISFMRDYVKRNGFSVYESDRRFSISDIHLVEKEPIYGSPVISELSYHEFFDYLGRRKENKED